MLNSVWPPDRQTTSDSQFYCWSHPPLPCSLYSQMLDLGSSSVNPNSIKHPRDIDLQCLDTSRCPRHPDFRPNSPPTGRQQHHPLIHIRQGSITTVDKKPHETAESCRLLLNSFLFLLDRQKDPHNHNSVWSISSLPFPHILGATTTSTSQRRHRAAQHCRQRVPDIILQRHHPPQPQSRSSNASTAPPTATTAKQEKSRKAFLVHSFDRDPSYILA